MNEIIVASYTVLYRSRPTMLMVLQLFLYSTVKMAPQKIIDTTTSRLFLIFP